jgi:hypothetical protein
MAVDWQGDAVLGRIRAAANRGVATGIHMIEAKAVDLIMSPPKSGMIYRRRGVEHQASAPGEAPANDTSRLVNSRTVDLVQAQMLGRLTFRTDYAAALEFGTQSMEARPYARRAAAEESAAVQDAIASEIRAELR